MACKSAQHSVELWRLEPFSKGTQLPGIRKLAVELVVRPATVAKAHAELEHEGLLELRQGSGAFISAGRRAPSQVQRSLEASRQLRKLIKRLRQDGLSEDEIRHVFEAELLHPVEVLKSGDDRYSD